MWRRTVFLMLLPDITLTNSFFTSNTVMEKCSQDDSRAHQHEGPSSRQEIKYAKTARL